MKNDVDSKLSKKKSGASKGRRRKLILEQTLLQREWAARRKQNMQLRAAVLAASSTLAMLIQLIDSGGPFRLVIAAFALAAAALGLVALFPADGEEVDPMHFRKELYAGSDDEFELSLIDIHSECLNNELRQNRKIGSFVRIGFSLLGCAAFVVICSILVGTGN